MINVQKLSNGSVVIWSYVSIVFYTLWAWCFVIEPEDFDCFQYSPTFRMRQYAWYNSPRRYLVT